MRARLLFACLCAVISSISVSATDREWENPVYETVDQAVSAARIRAPDVKQGGPPALRFFVDLTLAAGDVIGAHPSESISRMEIEDILITHPTAFVHNAPQRRTIERFVDDIPRQKKILEGRLARFGYPETPGLVYLRLVDSVDAFADLSGASSDKMTQVGGVTYYCRYIVLPLSYVGEHNVRELRRTAALNSSIDVEDTIRRWQRESFANLTSTFRHELVHVRTNSTLDVPTYSDRVAYPTWFHEGTATYLAADPSSGLSRGYQEFQRLFFYLAQRHGVQELQQFYTTIFNGTDVRTALADVYSIAEDDALFARSARWYRVKETIKTALWIAVLAIVIAAFRGADRPYIGGLQVLVGSALLLAVATGIAEHLYGLRGPEVVMAVKIGFVGVAVFFGFRGFRRIRRHRAGSASAA